MNIAPSDARALFTKMLIDVYQERPKVTSFLRSYFPSNGVSPTKEISVEVERMGEKIAVDVVRGTEGDRVAFSKSTERNYVPPLYRLYYDITQMDIYDRVLGSQGNANAPLFAELMNRVSDRVGSMQDMIERSIELQCAQVLEDGIVQLKSGDNIDYRRRAQSKVDLGAGNYFANAIDPFPVFNAGATFLRTYGRNSGGTFDVILGDQALTDLLNNAKFNSRQNLFHLQLDQVSQPVRNSVGGALHGYITAGSYTFRLWTYPQIYDDATGAFTSYMNTKKMVIIPIAPRFKTAFAAVPQLISEPGQMPVQEQYVIGNFRDERNATHDFDIQAAPLVIPVAVDQIYTVQVVA